MLSSDAIYVQVFADRIVVSNIDAGLTCTIQRSPHSASPRMLVGNFTLSEQELKAGVKSVRRGLRAPEILVHPMERIEGGVPQVEERVFLELGRGAGASRVAVHTGAPLAGDHVRTAIRAYKR